MGRRGLGGRHDGGDFLFAMVRGDSGTRVKSWGEVEYPREWGLEAVSDRRNRLSANDRNGELRDGEGAERVPWPGLIDDGSVGMVECMASFSRYHCKMANGPSQFSPYGNSVQADPQIADGSTRGGILIAMAHPCRRHVAGSRRHGFFTGRDAVRRRWWESGVWSLGKMEMLPPKKTTPILQSSPPIEMWPKRPVNVLDFHGCVCPIRHTSRRNCGSPRRSSWATNRGTQLDDEEKRAPGTWRVLALALTGRAGQ